MDLIRLEKQGVFMAVNYVKLNTGSTYLSTPFGLELAMKKTGMTEDQLEELVGRYKKGKRKGLLKGKLCWMKVTGGGWVKTGRYDFESMSANGFVCKDIGLCFAFGIVLEVWGSKDEYKWGDDWSDGYVNEYEQLLARAVYEKHNKRETA